MDVRSITGDWCCMLGWIELARILSLVGSIYSTRKSCSLIKTVGTKFLKRLIRVFCIGKFADLLSRLGPFDSTISEDIMRICYTFGPCITTVLSCGRSKHTGCLFIDSFKFYFLFVYRINFMSLLYPPHISFKSASYFLG